jgi:hypothetical protein
MNIPNDMEAIDNIGIAPSMNAAAEGCTAGTTAHQQGVQGDDEHASPEETAPYAAPAAAGKRGRGRPRKAHPLTPKQRAKDQRWRDATRDFPDKRQAASPEYWREWSLTALLAGVRRAIKNGYPEAVRRIAMEMERRAKVNEAEPEDEDY